MTRAAQGSLSALDRAGVGVYCCASLRPSTSSALSSCGSRSASQSSGVIRTASDLTRELYFAQPNQRITLTVRREGQLVRLPVTLGTQSL